jgi:hypothetical protein
LSAADAGYEVRRHDVGVEPSPDEDSIWSTHASSSSMRRNAPRRWPP